jgi:predicted AAA+ superfamily ATPase
VNEITKRYPIAEGNPAFGDAFEHFIILEIRAYIGLTGKDYQLCYWRSKSGYEVDVVIGNKISVEIKATKQVTSKHLKGLKALKEERLIESHIIVSRDRISRIIDDIKAYYWEEFIKLLWRGKIL